MRTYALIFAILVGAVAPALAGDQQDSLPVAEAGAAPVSQPFNDALCCSDKERPCRRGFCPDTPAFFGDLMGSAVVGVVGFGPPVNANVLAFLPNVQQASAIKIAEGDSPRPEDRFYYLLSFYGGVTINPAAPPLDVGRHVLGFEKTLFGSNFSVGMRLPIFSFGGDPSYDNAFIGDISIITKYALVNNRETGNVLSVGLSVTVPSGGFPTLQTVASPVLPGGPFIEPRDRAVTLQPYVGYVYNLLPRIFIQGFHSVAVPTDSNEPTFMANDLGLGLWLYRNPDGVLFRGVAPVCEIHVNTPFNHRDMTGLGVGQTVMIDSVTLTTGLSIMLPRSVLGGAVGIPLGNAQNRIEAVVSYSLRF
jgi:hypothetical protein